MGRGSEPAGQLGSWASSSGSLESARTLGLSSELYIRPSWTGPLPRAPLSAPCATPPWPRPTPGNKRRG